MFDTRVRSQNRYVISKPVWMKLRLQKGDRISGALLNLRNGRLCAFNDNRIHQQPGSCFRVTVPMEIREKAGVEEGDRIKVIIEKVTRR
jgi:hypothetical protein